MFVNIGIEDLERSLNMLLFTNVVYLSVEVSREFRIVQEFCSNSALVYKV